MNGLWKNVKNLHFWAFWAKMTNFGQFLDKTGQTGIFFKKALGTFFSHLQALTNCKVSEKVMNGFQATAWRTYVLTDAQTWILRSRTTSSRDQKIENKLFRAKNPLITIFTIFTHFMTSLSPHKFCFYPKITKKILGEKIMSLWAWNGSHTSDPEFRLVKVVYFIGFKEKTSNFSWDITILSNI